MDWNDDSYPNSHDDEFGLPFLITVMAALVSIAAGIVTFGASGLYFIDLLFFDDVLWWPIEVAFGILTLLVVCFCMSDYPKNPIVWYIHYRNIEISFKPLEDSEHPEMVIWMSENIKGTWIAHKHYRKYKFARKSDALAFKLRWG